MNKEEGLSTLSLAQPAFLGTSLHSQYSSSLSPLPQILPGRTAVLGGMSHSQPALPSRVGEPS